MEFNYKKWIWFGAAVIFVVTADQITKKWAAAVLAKPVAGRFPPPCNPDGSVEQREKMMPYNKITVVRGYWHFRYVENCGGVFGFLSARKESLRRPFFYITNILAMLFLIYLFIRVKENEKVLTAAFPIILGGAVGNVIDRISLGYVVDFIHWHIKDKAQWPTFNVADIGITVGLVLILFDSFFLAPGRERKEKKQEADATWNSNTRNGSGSALLSFSSLPPTR
jgi:signal peptidase II